MLHKVLGMRCTSGFYAIRVAAWLNMDNDNAVASPDSMGSDMRVLSGCGKDPQAIPVKNDCFKMTSVVLCGSMGKPWSCTKDVTDA